MLAVAIDHDARQVANVAGPRQGNRLSYRCDGLIVDSRDQVGGMEAIISGTDASVIRPVSTLPTSVGSTMTVRVAWRASHASSEGWRHVRSSDAGGRLTA